MIQYSASIELALDASGDISLFHLHFHSIFTFTLTFTPSLHLHPIFTFIFILPNFHPPPCPTSAAANHGNQYSRTTHGVQPPPSSNAEPPAPRTLGTSSVDHTKDRGTTAHRAAQVSSRNPWHRWTKGSLKWGTDEGTCINPRRCEAPRARDTERTHVAC